MMIMGIKTKKVINIAELIVIGLIVWSILGTYLTDNSFSRFTVRNQFLKLPIDVIFIALLIFRFTKIRLNFNKSFQELKGLKIIEKATFGLYLVFLLPDLLNWYKWNFYLGLYIEVFIAFSLPLLFLSIEVVERSSQKENRIKNYIGVIVLFVISLILYTVYLDQIQ